MSQLEDLVHYTYKHLFDISSEALESRDIIQMKDKLPAKVIDNTTFNMIEIPELCQKPPVKDWWHDYAYILTSSGF